MKRYNNLFTAITDIENIQLAVYNASRGKAHYREVKQIMKNPDAIAHQISELLVNKSFKNAPYIHFSSMQYGKKREIYKLPFYPDRIIQHAVCQVLEPIWDAQYIRDTFACIKGRGIHDGVQRVKDALSSDPNGTAYCLKIDIKKYYPSVNNSALKAIVRIKIKCKDTLWLLDEIINSHQGLPIGNYTSQHLSNIYLSGFDHFVKEKLKIKHYFRYCDDIVMLSATKTELWNTYKAVESYLDNELKLQIKDNYQVFPVQSRGIDFLGYRFFHKYTLLRKSIATKMKRRVRQISKHAAPHKSKSVRSTLASYSGWMKHANCHNLKMVWMP